MLDRYLIPLAPFMLIAINSVLCLFFFLCLEHEMRIMQLRWKRRQVAQESATGELKAQMAELSARVRDAEERAGVLVPPTPPRSGLEPEQAQPSDPHVAARRASREDRGLFEPAAARSGVAAESFQQRGLQLRAKSIRDAVLNHPSARNRSF